MLDVNWLTEDFYTDLYLAFKDEKGTIHYIYPKTENSEFMIDEIKPNLMGTKAFLVNTENAFDYSEQFLPAYGCEFNIREQHTQVEVNNDFTSFRVTAKFKGCISTISRIKENMADKDSLIANFKKHLETKLENVSIDSLVRGNINPSPPFDYALTYIGSQSSKLVSVNDSIFSINIGQWIDHTILSSDLETRNLDYYTSFPYTEKLTVEYIFTSPIKLLNEKEFNTSCDNEFGTYSISAKNSTGNKIQIESIYCIKSFVIPALKYNLLKEINQRQRQFTESHMIIEKVNKQNNN